MAIYENSGLKSCKDGHVSVRAEFEYTYLKRKYREDAVETLSRREEAHFKEGQTYTVYVNPKNPRYIRCTNKKWTWIDV